MRDRKKLNDAVDLDVHQMLTDLSERLGIPRAKVTSRLLRCCLNHAHVGEMFLAGGEWKVFPAAERVVSIGRPGKPTGRDGAKGGLKFAQIVFR